MPGRPPPRMGRAPAHTASQLRSQGGSVGQEGVVGEGHSNAQGHRGQASAGAWSNARQSLQGNNPKQKRTDVQQGQPVAAAVHHSTVLLPRRRRRRRAGGDACREHIRQGVVCGGLKATGHKRGTIVSTGRLLCRPEFAKVDAARRASRCGWAVVTSAGTGQPQELQ